MIIPKQPAYKGERYLYSPAINLIADDSDTRIPLDKLAQRFPELKKINLSLTTPDAKEVPPPKRWF
jgi:hypothetical protein